MKNNLFSIGEISKIKGITIKALRFYERLGLIKPCYKEPGTKYRYYSMEQFLQLDIIKASRSMGISPKDIKTILDKKDNKQLLDFLKAQKEEAVLKIAELQKNIFLIDTVRNNICNSMEYVTNQDTYFREIPLRRIVGKQIDHDVTEEAIIKEYSDLYKLIEEEHLSNTYETGIIFMPDEKMEFHPSQIFNTVTIDNNLDSPMVSSIPSGRYLCICYNKHNVNEKTDILKKRLEQDELQPKLILQVDLLNNVFDDENPYVELQALID